MASSEKVHYTIFPIVGTVNDRGLILYVEEKHFTATTTLTQGTTLTSFMSTEDVPKGDAITQGFGSYIYQEQLPKEGNRLRFVFLQNKTTAQTLEVVKPLARINQVTDWPNWLLSLYAVEAEFDLQRELTVTASTTVADTAIKRILDRYILITGGSFNTLHEVEEFFAPSPIPSLVATEPRPDVVSYNFFGAQNQINCIHREVRIPEPYSIIDRVPDFGVVNSEEVRWEEGSIFPATNHVAWIPHYRILQITERDGGYYYRRHRVIPPKLPRKIEI